MNQVPESPTHNKDDFIFDAFYVGAIGGSVVALFFLVIDLLNAQPFFTPSLMGTVLFTGVAAEGVTSVQLNMVTYYTLVHFLTFGILGAAVSIAVHEIELHAQHPFLVLTTLFLAFEIGFVLMANIFMSGVISVVGVVPITIANILAAGAMGGFLLVTHRPGTWNKIKHAVHLT